MDCQARPHWHAPCKMRPGQFPARAFRTIRIGKPVSSALILHIAAGILGIFSGATAVVAAKGGHLHRLSGTIFFVAMLITSAMASILAISIPERGNFVGGVFTFYLVASGWMIVRRPPGKTGVLDIGGAILAGVVIAICSLFALQASRTPTHEIDGTGVPNFIVVACMAALAAALDLKMILRGGLTGKSRIARHVWRMCTAFFVATGSFFLGQQKVMPVFIQGSPVLIVLALAPLVLMVFWLFRVRVSRRFATVGAPA